MKKLLYIFIFLSIFTLAACTSDTDDTGRQQDDNQQVDDNNDDQQDPQILQLTLTELAEFDGQEGRDAYIAVDGIIYDVTGVSAWTGGTHNGNMAGTDVSNVINNAPHGRSVLDGLEAIGEIVE